MSPTQPHSIPMGWLSPFCSQGHTGTAVSPTQPHSIPMGWLSPCCYQGEMGTAVSLTQPHSIPMGWLSPYCDQEHMGGQQRPQPSSKASLWGGCHPAGTRDRQGLQCPQPSPAASLWGGCRPTVTRNTWGDSSVPSPAPKHPYGVAVTLLLPGTHVGTAVSPT